MNITTEQLNASYEVAKLVFENSLKAEAGAKLLHEAHGMNIVSARDLIRNFDLMVEGRVFVRSMSAPATEIYLARMEADFGTDILARAISAVNQHISYYEGLRTITLHKLRSVVASFSPHLARTVDLKAQQTAFSLAVARSLRDSSEARRARLKDAPKAPIRLLATVTAFVRNQDVVAEVLFRATGTCEGCNNAAPFLRRNDGTPYLEVHHKQQLSAGGEDTVENAIALCPNCHRKIHFGADA